MRKFRESLIWAATVTMVLVCFSGCAESQQACKGLQICSMTSAIGGVEQNQTDKQRMSYAINLSNDSDQETYISFVEPLLSASINGRIISGDTRIEVNKKLAARGSLEVKGEFVFDSQDLSKQDILALEPIITGYRVGTEQQIELPGNGGTH